MIEQTNDCWSDQPYSSNSLGLLFVDADGTIFLIFPQISLQIYIYSGCGTTNMLAYGVLGLYRTFRLFGMNEITFKSIKSCNLCFKTLQFSIECLGVPEWYSQLTFIPYPGGRGVGGALTSLSWTTNPWADELADDHTTWERDQTLWEASLVPAYLTDGSSAVDLNIGFTQGPSS